MTFFEKELMNMFGKNEALTDIRCVGNVLMGRLTSNTIAKISLVTSETHEEYTAALIRVIDPQKGEIDNQRISFCDVFGSSAYIWSPYGESAKWYAKAPDKGDFTKINNAAEQYLEMFLEPVQDIRMGM